MLNMLVRQTTHVPMIFMRCCHCSGRFEKEGKDLVKFLKNLFGDRVIQTNLVLVVTRVSQSTQAQKDRHRENKPLNELMAGYRDVVQKEFGLKDAMPVIDIDTCPVSFTVTCCICYEHIVR